MSRPVLSADDVRAAHRRREHRLIVAPGSLVTPLARDEAARWGIEIVEEAGHAMRGASRADEAAAAPSATCDPGDLDRVIERVRARVPGADPALVRDIARRVLDRLGS